MAFSSPLRFSETCLPISVSSKISPFLPLIKPVLFKEFRLLKIQEREQESSFERFLARAELVSFSVKSLFRIIFCFCVSRSSARERRTFSIEPESYRISKIPFLQFRFIQRYGITITTLIKEISFIAYKVAV
ncbi:MAG: hypothetical protein ISS48_00295 [Candidatus Aenigmarchaeota archaeon]|nr:hypothetical protein [Candidatus Aenigmarchaeota archaeon]